MDCCLLPKVAGTQRQYVNIIACVFPIGGDCEKVPLVPRKDPVCQSIHNTY